MKSGCRGGSRSFLLSLSLSFSPSDSLSHSQRAMAEEEGQGVRRVDSEETRVLRGALADGVAALGELSRVGGSTHTAAVTLTIHSPCFA